ncbi:uncharacterized protein LOC114672218 isoform X1 [Macaca mulatta]
MSQAPFPIEPLEGGVLERVHAWGAEHCRSVVPRLGEVCLCGLLEGKRETQLPLHLRWELPASCSSCPRANLTVEEGVSRCFPHDPAGLLGCFCCLRLPCCSLDKGAGVNQSLWPSAASTILSKDCSYFLSTAGCQALWSALMNRTGEVPALRELMSNREADQVKGNTVKRTCNEEDPENM